MSGTVLRSGWLNKHSKGILGEKWKKVYVVLYKDSTFCWYKDKGDNSARGRVMLQSVCKFLTCGINVRTIPHSPDLPSWASIENVIAFPEKPMKKSSIYFFLTNDPEEFNSWMRAIVDTLPAAPHTSPNALLPSNTQQPYATSFSSEQSVSTISPQPYRPTNVSYGASAPPVPPAPVGPSYSQPTVSSIGFEQLSMPTPYSGPVQPNLPYTHTASNYPPPMPVNYPIPAQNPVQPYLSAPNYHGYSSNLHYPVQGYNPQYPQQQGYNTQYSQQQNYGIQQPYMQPPTTQTSVVYQKSPKKSKGTGKMLAGIAGGAVAGYAASRIFRPFGGFGWGHGSWGSGSWGSFSGGSFGSFGGCD